MKNLEQKRPLLKDDAQSDASLSKKLLGFLRAGTFHDPTMINVRSFPYFSRNFRPPTLRISEHKSFNKRSIREKLYLELRDCRSSNESLLRIVSRSNREYQLKKNPK